MKVLLTGHGVDRGALDAARRAVAHDKLVLLTPDPSSPDIEAVRENERLAGVQVEARGIEPADFMGCLAAACLVLDAHPRGSVAVHVAGGPNLLASALLLASFERGVDAFFCHPRGISRLPVARGVSLAERFTVVERAILLAIPDRGEFPLPDLVAAGIPGDQVRRALYRMRKEGLVRATDKVASLTSTGAYYRAHFAAAVRGAQPR